MRGHARRGRGGGKEVSLRKRMGEAWRVEREEREGPPMNYYHITFGFSSCFVLASPAVSFTFLFSSSFYFYFVCLVSLREIICRFVTTTDFEDRSKRRQ